ncbi:DUF4760 domain-containing protein [Stenotrophomonas maltophilia]|uniref:DUF4760 domain-containing protein n=1 Tax=Stenotrophomonas maltophilia TaxID=40324 RepID=UPI0011B0884D|nr:DUF4760 domain-containing protein [Stenotrophomonas maltophilia]MBN5037253.1 DUF4760 domain-containing protein [Stenotrophomonas maltophilia]MBN5053834.1 DUF4760 domain-containing protein [Stenotrophomonas maltophilia]HEL5329121.1 DUF4760 domain-containing protein [Stenotrophomonas maltophilia]
MSTPSEPASSTSSKLQVGSIIGGALVVVALGAMSCYLLPTDMRTVPNYVLIVQTVVIVLGLGSLALLALQLRAANRQAACSVQQLTLTAQQLTMTAKWNKTLSYHQFFGRLIAPELADKIRACAKKHEFDDSFTTISCISQQVLQAIWTDVEDHNAVSTYLDEFEEFCAAVNAGVVEKSYAYGIEATRVIRAATVFEPFIRRARSETRYSRAYFELEGLATDWRSQRDQEEQEARKTNGVQQQH